MTLDDAIVHADWVADNCEGECSEDHKQLAEWLLELKRLRTENDKLRETLREFHACSSQVGCESCGYSDHCEILDTIRDC